VYEVPFVDNNEFENVVQDEMVKKDGARVRRKPR
jgi:hypothetical protein